MKYPKLYSALIALAITSVLAIAIAYLATDVMRQYGWGLFLVTPISCGALSVAIYNRNRVVRLKSSIATSVLAGLCSLVVFLLLGREGLICLLMAIPVVLPAFIIGGLIGHYISRNNAHRGFQNIACLILFLIAPIWMGFEKVASEEEAVRSVESRVRIKSTRDLIWREVIAFSPIPEPSEFSFRAGIAYPIKARIDGVGVGAIRYCQFTTGDFVEPITVWDSGYHLAFNVDAQPVPMIEVSPYSSIHPPHLDWAIQSKRGEFRIEQVSDGSYDLVGRTWFVVHMSPGIYWSSIVDHYIHMIHLRVLNHIKSTLENGA
jgi:hypothetical protein